jgi:hypothetical protein
MFCARLQCNAMTYEMGVLDYSNGVYRSCRHHWSIVYAMNMGVFDWVALGLGCTSGGSVYSLVSLSYSSARHAGVKMSLSVRLYSYAIFQRIAAARLRWARGKWFGAILHYWPGSQVQTKHKMRTSWAHEPVLQTRKADLFLPGFVKRPLIRGD